MNVAIDDTPTLAATVVFSPQWHGGSACQAAPKQDAPIKSRRVKASLALRTVAELLLICEYCRFFIAITPHECPK